MSSSSALAPASIQLDPRHRLALADRLIDLCTAALLLQHDQAGRLMKLCSTQFYGSRTDRVLLAGVARLTAFVADRAEDGIGLPTWHPCYVSPAVFEDDES